MYQQNLVRSRMKLLYPYKALLGRHETITRTCRCSISFISTVGIEVHAQIDSTSKLFSSAGVDFNAAVNSLVSPFDAAHPGTLPSLNKCCVKAAVLTAKALNCSINKTSTFDRKHYFYSDLPAGYQITQQRQPIAKNGYLSYVLLNSGCSKKLHEKKVRIKQIQLEQDSGKSLHDFSRSIPVSLIDLNRAGVGLMEIVFEPDLRNGDEAVAAVKELIAILKKIGTCSCKMEEGALRVDVNVSVSSAVETLGVRTEVKNLCSVRFMKQAIDFEIQRQCSLLAKGGSVVSETRAFSAEKNCTVPMRDKEEKQDYRFMPEPNLPPLHLSDNSDPLELRDKYLNINDVCGLMPELPQQTRKKLMTQYNIPLQGASLLVSNDLLLEKFIFITDTTKISGKTCMDFLALQFLGEVNHAGKELSDVSVSCEQLAQVLIHLESGIITREGASEVLKHILSGDVRSVQVIIDAENLRQVMDEGFLSCLCDEILHDHPEAVLAYKKGKTKALNFFMGQIRHQTHHRANMKLAKKLFLEKLRDESK
ncbi:unnamed protein product [Darwinula stevensoni]|uniref:Glutamyl-tRNA(Gln) amidotransferase subunit B, mitochondrial n=1 Tax=Darwinula stevensoni TaxID=69355 RepID=A0A7R8X8Y0_9CRUS|nr:unnamed protein product [Darwinula stevensoni]CAG0882004.1 unnamed protein product [Darwinula stevensoni]